MGALVLVVVGSFFIVRVEVSPALYQHAEVGEKSERLMATWELPVLLRNPRGEHGFKSWAAYARTVSQGFCSRRALQRQLRWLHKHFGAILAAALPVFPMRHRETCAKEMLLGAIERIAKGTGHAIFEEDGTRRYGGYSLRVSVAPYLPRLGVELHKIQLLGSWDSNGIMCYVRQAPLAAMTKDVRLLPTFWAWRHRAVKTFSNAEVKEDILAILRCELQAIAVEQRARVSLPAGTPAPRVRR